jgi:hypothetical protein
MRKALQVLLLIVFLVSSFIFTTGINLVHAATVPPSIINSDTTWTVGGSPYNLSGPTLVSYGATLTIEAGATININTFYLQVNGTLNARGTSVNPIHINSAKVNAGEIKFVASSTSWNEQTGIGCIIQNAIINQTVISIVGCSVKIDGNIFYDSADMQHENVAINTGRYVGDSSVFVSSSIISNNKFSQCGIDVVDSSIVSKNIIEGGMGIYGGSPVISENTISGGSSYFWIGRSFERDYNTIAIDGYCSPTIAANNIQGSISFNANENGGVQNDTRTYVNSVISGNEMGAILIQDGAGHVVISNNIMSGVMAGKEVATTISGNLITKANVGLEIGNAVVKDNTIANCPIAITVNNGGSPVIRGNNIQNFSQFSIKLIGTPNDVNASNNWWGTTDTGAIAKSIYDQKNDFNLGKVNFAPILASSNPSAPPLTLFLSTPKIPTTIATSSPTPTEIPEASPTASVTTPEFSIIPILILIVAAPIATTLAIKKTTKNPSHFKL